MGMYYKDHKEKQVRKYLRIARGSKKYAVMSGGNIDESIKEEFHRKPYESANRKKVDIYGTSGETEGREA